MRYRSVFSRVHTELHLGFEFRMYIANKVIDQKIQTSPRADEFGIL